MNKHYFSDITDLFLKVKKEENIPIDANAKESIKKMLHAKINKMKAANTYEKLEPIGGKQSFWTTWKRQLIGVPASLVAVMVIVFAMSSLQPSIPKDDFSPRQTETSTTTEEVQKEQAFDRPLVKTAQKPDTPKQEDRQSDRSLNKTEKEEQIIVAPPVEEEEKLFIDEIQYTAGQTFILQTPEETEPEPETETETSIGQAQEIKPETAVNKNDAKEDTTTQDSLDANVPLDTAREQETQVSQEVQEQQEVQETQTTETPLDQTLSTQVNQTAITAYPVYVYKDKSLKESPAFSEEKLAKLTKSKTPDLISVYYVENNQVVVEIEENRVTKWYLFDNIDGTWTISKYEKFITKDVIK
jgi:hypothetical protein